VRAEIFRPDAPDDADDVVAVATWADGVVRLEARDASVDGLERLLRSTAVVVPGGFPRRPGTSGDTVLQPGSPEWFREALLTRTEPLGLGVRFVAEDVTNGWDPAANYRTFAQQDRRLAAEPSEPT
jgi:hypothetical protein